MRFGMFTAIILLAPIHLFAIPDNPGDILNIPPPKFSVSDAIKKVTDYIVKDNTIIKSDDHTSIFFVVSAVYGRPDALFPIGTVQITDKGSEPSWFVTLHNSKTDSKRIYRLMDDGVIQPIMHLD